MSIDMDRDGAIARLTIARADRLNAIDAATRTALIDALETVRADDAVRAVVITGEGERAFSAGQDLEELAALDEHGAADWVRSLAAMYGAVRALDVGCVAAINGVAVGAGLQIALWCDLRVAHRGARLGQPEIKAGLGSVLGTRFMESFVSQGLNARLSLLGEIVGAEEAFAGGLLTHLVDDGAAVMPRAMELAEALAAMPPVAMRVTKANMRAMTQGTFDGAVAFALAEQPACFASGEPAAARTRSRR